MNIYTTSLLWFTYIISLYFAVFWLIVFLIKKESFPQRKLTLFPLVTIVVPAYNEEASIVRTLDHLFALDYPHDKLEIIIVNDGSTDNTAHLVERLIHINKDRTLILINQRNKGKGASLNTALKQAKGKFFVCLDADSFVQPDALQKILPYFSVDTIAAVLPALKVEQPQKTIQKLQWYEYIVNLFYKELMGKLNCIHVTPGPFSVYCTQILHRVGGFDEDNITEDLEMALKLQKHHYSIIQILDTTVTTLAPSTYTELYAQRNRWFKGATINAWNYRNMLFNTKHGDFGFIQMPTIILSGIIALILMLTAIYYSLTPVLQYLYHISLVDFDFFTILQHVEFTLQFLDIDYITLFVGVVMLCTTAFVLKKSQTISNEKLTTYGSAPLFLYLFIYFFFLGFVWLGVLFDLLLRKKQRW